MQTSEIQTTTLSRRPQALSTFVGAAFKGLTGFFAFILHLRARDEDAMVARYAGCGWNDAIERQVVDDIANRHCTRL